MTTQTTPQEYFYISSGAKNKMYTLRTVFWEPVFISRAEGTRMVKRDWFIQNLSTDYETAVRKASDYVAASSPGSKLQTTEFAVDDITRTTDADRQAAKEEYERKQAEEKRQAEEAKTRLHNNVIDGLTNPGEIVMLSGKHQGTLIKDVPVDYLKWYANNGPYVGWKEWKAVQVDPTQARQQEAVIAYVAALPKDITDPLGDIEMSSAIGLTGEVVHNVELKIVAKKDISGMYGDTTVMTLLTESEDGNPVVIKCFTKAKGLTSREIGSTLTATVTIKDKGYDSFLNIHNVTTAKLTKVK